jgi:PAS domain S-box-containing protein
MTFRQLPGAVWTTDRDLRLSYMTGRLVNGIIFPQPGTSIFEYFGPQAATDEIVTRHVAALSGSRQSFQYKYRERWYAVLIDPLVDEKGALAGCVGTAFDITDRQMIEERLARSQTLLEEAQRVAHIGSFEWNIAGNTVTWSEELHRIYGIEPGEFEGTYDAFLKRVHPGDVESTTTTVFDALRNAKPMQYTHRVIRPDGRIRVLHTRADVIRDESGAPTRIVGSCWDVTEWQEAKENLENARSLLEATIESTADGLLVVDLNGKVTAYNQRFLSCWQIPAELAEERDDAKLLGFVLNQLEDKALRQPGLGLFLYYPF